ncbi:MAG TPA: NADH-quinone oxidoreductase subunit C [Steroidobacteraceae bacterium]|nr:NADH-quinone oxidoreductase subunit C [Steroidobacteraceae bacterium]
MSEKIEQQAAALAGRFGDSLRRLESRCGELGFEVDADRLLPLRSALRDEPEFAYEQLVDLTGVDYLDYGRGEWATSSATGTGFSRGVSRALSPTLTPALSREAGEGAEALSRGAGEGARRAGEGALDGADPQRERRFAVVYHLLSVARNQRLRLRAWCEPGEPPMLPTVTQIWSAADWYEREAFDLFGIVFHGHPDLRRILTDYGFVGHPFRKDFPLIGNVEVRYDPDKGRVVYEPVSIEPRTLVPRVLRDDNRYDPGLKGGTDRG